MIEGNLKKNSRGFSLIELSILLAMTAILAAFSIPMLTSAMRSMQLISDARNIATTMTYAKTRAASQMTHYKLTFKLSTNEWYLERYDRDTDKFELEDAKNWLSNAVSNSGITFKTSSSSNPDGFPPTSSGKITFNSRGLSIDDTGSVTTSIVYLSNDDLDYAVSVSLTGKVQIWKHADDQWLPQ